MRRLLAVLLIALACGGDARADRARATITVSAAVSLTDVLQEVAKACQSATGIEVRYNFAGSNVLARQIVDGAPVDVFVSADEAQMQLAQTAGAIVADTRLDLLGNRLAIVTARDTPAIADVRDLLRPDVKRIAIADPEAVPAGVYSRTYLQTIGLWDELRRRIVPVANVRAALTAADTGSVQAAFVYESDTLSARSARLAFVVTDAQAPRIVYPAAVTRASKHADDAHLFLEFLRGPAASDLFRKYKLIPLAELPGR